MIPDAEDTFHVISTLRGVNAIALTLVAVEITT